MNTTLEEFHNKKALITEYVETMVAGGMFPGLTVEQGVARVILGESYGFEPAAALTNLYTTPTGATGIKGHGYAAAIALSDKYTYAVDKTTAEECTVSIYTKDGKKIGDHTLRTKEIVTNGDAWVNNPRNALLYRTLAEAARMYAPDLFGGAGAYTDGELPTLDTTTPAAPPSPEQWGALTPPENHVELEVFEYEPDEPDEPEELEGGVSAEDAPF